jgi:hypothetical protein
VLAAAVVGGAGAIVTDNVRHFPRSAVPNHIQITKPARFAADTVAVSPETALRAVEAIVGRRKSPPVTVDEVLDSLIEVHGMHEAVDLLRIAG